MPTYDYQPERSFVAYVRSTTEGHAGTLDTWEYQEDYRNINPEKRLKQSDGWLTFNLPRDAAAPMGFLFACFFNPEEQKLLYQICAYNPASAFHGWSVDISTNDYLGLYRTPLAYGKGQFWSLLSNGKEVEAQRGVLSPVSLVPEGKKAIRVDKQQKGPAVHNTHNLYASVGRGQTVDLVLDIIAVNVPDIPMPR
ncbi:hypothetical protein D3C81_879080 [compost metagenome]|uniref:Uncharacterized protein n=1 Tax=Pseudomonas wadenswilerensis TaxID=1785161 RepID=A0A380T0U1_9PSED|nr:hypothetical protein [Pseudomonas wadenswilerensis]SUQ63126.1 hypothetical protein CCOS864_02576 [Pseudomonas wadenswilerensis]